MPPVPESARAATTTVKEKLYKPGVFTVIAMAAGVGMFVFLKVRHNGLEIAGVIDVVLYAVTLGGLAMLATVLRGRIRVDDEAVEIVGLLSHRRYRLADILRVSTERGADVTFELLDGRIVALPFWIGTDGWGVAAALRARLPKPGPGAAATPADSPPGA